MWDLILRDERVDRVPSDGEQPGNLWHVKHVAFVEKMFELLGGFHYYAASLRAIDIETPRRERMARCPHGGRSLASLVTAGGELDRGRVPSKALEPDRTVTASKETWPASSAVRISRG